ncbi:MAG: rhomboid family intramembrane serine protease [Phycisphaerae bacterium]|nr:rhomboid family intramembrane serine protease [Phycisphaerae bacterium]
MGLHDRPYMGDGPRGGFGGGGPMVRGSVFGGMPKPTLAVKWLLIANIAMFFLQLLPHVTQSMWLIPETAWQIWRFIGFQFIHGDPMHLLFNMLGLYMLGVTLERAWGTKRFLVFYFTSGVFAGLCHVILAYTFAPGFRNDPLVGASGGVYAIVLACAILFPHIRLILLFFPVPIRVAAVLFFALTSYGLLGNILSPDPRDTTSHAAHFGGLVVAAFWIWGLPKLSRATAEARSRHEQGAWQRKLRRQAAEQAEVDRILDKVHEQGLNSLTAKEKRTLKEATQRQRNEGR